MNTNKEVLTKINKHIKDLSHVSLNNGGFIFCFKKFLPDIKKTINYNIIVKKSIPFFGSDRTFNDKRLSYVTFYKTPKMSMKLSDILEINGIAIYLNSDSNNENFGYNFVRVETNDICINSKVYFDKTTLEYTFFDTENFDFTLQKSPYDLINDNFETIETFEL